MVFPVHVFVFVCDNKLCGKHKHIGSVITKTCPCNTVNPEIFAGTLFSLIFAKSLLRENKVLANKELL